MGQNKIRQKIKKLNVSEKILLVGDGTLILTKQGRTLNPLLPGMKKHEKDSTRNLGDKK